MHTVITQLRHIIDRFSFTLEVNLLKLLQFKQHFNRPSSKNIFGRTINATTLELVLERSMEVLKPINKLIALHAF